MRRRASRIWTRKGICVNDELGIEECGRMAAGLEMCESNVFRVYRGKEAVGGSNAVAKESRRGERRDASVQTGRNGCTENGSDVDV